MKSTLVTIFIEGKTYEKNSDKKIKTNISYFSKCAKKNFKLMYFLKTAVITESKEMVL
jgi:hypothetical protein